MKHPLDGALGDRASDLHVIPQYGREHIPSVTCWCRPKRDMREVRVLIHEPREVA